MKNTKRTIIIGGGFYGLSVALYLYESLGVHDILILEKEAKTMTRASYINQARVHNGYHYPRSILTGYRSAVNFPRFTKQFEKTIYSQFDKYYGIAKHLSKVNAHQFKNFSEKIGSEISVAPGDIKKMFNPNLVEEVFKVREYAFDSHILRDELLKQIKEYPEIKLLTGQRVERIGEDEQGLFVATQKGEHRGGYILNCTYANINTLHRASNIPLVGLKHEITEMCLVSLPVHLKDFSITMMDGPFFSIMPFPSKKLYTLSHVRYTPHESWVDNDDTACDRTDTHDYLAKLPFHSNYKQMYNDVIRYIPALKDMKYEESIVEVKTVLMKSEGDDSRPILFKADLGYKNYVCIMGGKLDNIYDVYEELDKVYGKDE